MNKYKQFVEETGQLLRFTSWDYHNKLTMKNVDEMFKEFNIILGLEEK